MRQMRLAWPPVTRNIKITLAVLALFWIGMVQFDAFVYDYMLVSREAVFERYYAWTLLTYALWHGTFSHLLFNGVALWMFGSEVDQRWSDTKFWTVSLLSALGGGLAVAGTQQILFALGVPINHPTLGYSGAVMGLVGAYCWYNWNRSMYFFFMRMTGKGLLVLFVGFDLFMVLVANQPISISGHLGGLATGLLLASEYWRPWKLERAYRRFQQTSKFDQPERTPREKADERWMN